MGSTHKTRKPYDFDRRAAGIHLGSVTATIEREVSRGPEGPEEFVPKAGRCAACVWKDNRQIGRVSIACDGFSACAPHSDVIPRELCDRGISEQSRDIRLGDPSVAKA